MNTNINIDFKHLSTKARQNMAVVLWGALAVLIVFEGLVIQQSLAIMFGARAIEQTAKTQPVRINFGLYDTIAKRFSIDSSFQPTPVSAKNPFGLIEAPANN